MLTFCRPCCWLFSFRCCVYPCQRTTYPALRWAGWRDSGTVSPALSNWTNRPLRIQWLNRIAHHFDRSAWINPEESKYWDNYHTARTVQKIFPMFHLSVDGLAEAVQALVGARS